METDVIGIKQTERKETMPRTSQQIQSTESQKESVPLRNTTAGTLHDLRIAEDGKVIEVLNATVTLIWYEV